MSNLLAPAGFSDVEFEIYVGLLRAGRADGASLAGRLGLADDVVDAAIRHLADRGLVRRDHVLEPTYCAVSPDSAVAHLVAGQREQLNAMQRDADRLALEIADAHHETQEAAPVELVVGRTEVLDLCVELQQKAVAEVLMVDTAPYFPEGAQPNDPELAALERGVSYRCLYASASLREPDHRRHMEHYVGLGEEARVLDGAAPKMMIVDRQVALVIESDERPDPSRRLLVRNSSLLTCLLDRFHTSWDRAAPLHPGLVAEETGISPRDRQLLALLAAGLKDRAAAHALGVNERTIGRRINDLMRRLDADSRFQAGVLADRQGWIG